MKASATLKGIPDTFGRRTVYIRLADGPKRRFFATKIKIEPKYWDKKVIKHPNAKGLNDQIKDLVLKYELGGQKTDTNFYKYALQCLNEWENNKKQGTLTDIRSKVLKFKDFADVKLSDITPKLLTDYSAYCHSIGNQSNTTWACLKCVRMIVLKAIKEKLITENPFHSFKMPKYTDPQKVYLTQSQVDKIEEFAKTAPKEFKAPAAWFVISCYTGLRYSDQVRFKKTHIRAGRLVVYTSKTGRPVSIKINDKLKELLELVNYEPIGLTNEYYNRVLKGIAAICKIKENITCHTARHTFGTLCASAGISQEVTAALMGHNSIRTTAIYYQLTGTRIDGEFDKLF